MPVFKICIRPDPEAPDLAQGYVLATDRDDALATVDHPDAEVFETAMPWPGYSGQRVVWGTRPPPTEVDPRGFSNKERADLSDIGNGDGGHGSSVGEFA